MRTPKTTKDEEVTVTDGAAGGLAFEATAKSEGGIKGDAPVHVVGEGVEEETVGLGAMDFSTGTRVRNSDNIKGLLGNRAGVAVGPEGRASIIEGGIEGGIVHVGRGFCDGVVPGIVITKKGVGHGLWVEQVRGRTRLLRASGENDVLAGGRMGDGVS
jgi:hypothetical protein